MDGSHVRATLTPGYNKQIKGLKLMKTIIKRFIHFSLLFYFIVYILPLGTFGLFVPDETRYAEIPREMIASGISA